MLESLQAMSLLTIMEIVGPVRKRPAVGAITSKATCTVKDLGTLVSDCRKFGCIYAEPRGAIPTKQRDLPRIPITTP